VNGESRPGQGGSRKTTASQSGAHPTPAPPKDWLSHKELAAWLGVTEQALYYANHTGTGPRRHRFGKELRYSAGDITEWISRRAVES